MGAAMARNVLDDGFPLVVWNRTAERCAPLVAAGATAVPEPVALAVADVVVTMVSDGPAAHAVLVESGLVEALKPGSVVLEMSTIGPTAVGQLATEAQRHDVFVLDAPVSGSVSLAESAQLFAMVGGDEDAYERARPVLDTMTKGHIHLGPSGAGAAMKLAVNSMVAVTNESVAETLAFAERWGIDPERAYDVLAGGALASPFVLYKRSAFLDPESQAVAFSIDLMRKDVTLAEELAEDLGARLPTVEAAAEMLDEALAAGRGEGDIASVIDLLRARANGDAPPEPSHQTMEER
jgi:3-hydroxyisobutyrate dehydrogenase-like beta-hydroxyacid dehydrogenase